RDPARSALPRAATTSLGTRSGPAGMHMSFRKAERRAGSAADPRATSARQVLIGPATLRQITFRRSMARANGPFFLQQAASPSYSHHPQGPKKFQKTAAFHPKSNFYRQSTLSRKQYQPLSPARSASYISPDTV